MVYQLITSDPFESFLFPKLLEAKKYVLKYYPNVHCVIRHRKYNRTIRITSYYPKFGFETQSIKDINNTYNRLFNNFD